MDAEADRFMGHVTPEPNSGCWLWTGAVADERWSYGMFRTKQRRTVRAHRRSFELFRGAIPSGKMVLHRCDVPSCVNPEHLFIGDAADNARDMSAKGRQGGQVNPRAYSYPKPWLRGSRHDPFPCSHCGKTEKPLRTGLCHACYERRRKRGHL